MCIFGMSFKFLGEEVDSKQKRVYERIKKLKQKRVNAELDTSNAMIKDIEHEHVSSSEEENKMHRNAFWLRETSQDTKIMIKFTSNFNFELPVNEVKSGNHTLSSNDDRFNVAEKWKT